MKICYYCIKDTKANKFQQLWAAENDQVAIRNFKSLCNDASTLFGSYPEDFELYCVATFDNDDGSIVENFVDLVNGSSLVKEVKNESN